MLQNKRIALLGTGKLGETLLAGLLDSRTVSPNQVVTTAAHQERLSYLSQKYGVHTTLNNSKAVQGADIILICLKPQTVLEVLEKLDSKISEKQVIISAAASVPTSSILEALGKEIPIVRVMPNTPCVIKLGMTAISPGKFAKETHLAMAERIFGPIGRTIRLAEKHMDAVTGLSASGPAYFYMVIESLAEGGVKVGLPREVATELAAQTALGAAKMVLETREHPAKLKDAVTTPAGCTIDGLMELEAGGLRVALIKAVVQATKRAKELVSPN
ncbi:MAG: pyrroline-5-carboxylate reductase [Elusimicrobia bacterium]|nr:pyrroline-5-carboxylate reductase [Elusimicrobiota bacterium]